MIRCPDCGAEIDVDEDEVEEGEILSCPECESELEVTQTHPVHVNPISDDLDDEEDEESDDEVEEEDDEEEDDLDEEGRRGRRIAVIRAKGATCGLHPARFLRHLIQRKDLTFS